ncbi:hypothetical protein D934_09020 [Xylella fastidiosa subsp. sandyi Ann-1]|uniref:Uncharacterized protein n=1 Tax=Xylella fastidiosa subsp. sandyi Ann-1 TaxID=155920 RepID=A0A060HEF7_XYLFS|nr:hypothetical protein D934_07800 [Xylella fastidiosa subsp. sandyi Ann-1]AIC11407.1 hypothetical protein D934_09020 [Xylella fastidiosa subsp. sandyi Ann-1]
MGRAHLGTARGLDAKVLPVKERAQTGADPQQ